jgi:hypothetical protein
MLSFTVGNIPSALCSTILATLVARECGIFCNLETYLPYHILWGSVEFAYKNPMIHHLGSNKCTTNWEYFPKYVRIVATTEFPGNTFQFTQLISFISEPLKRK